MENKKNGNSYQKREIGYPQDEQIFINQIKENCWNEFKQWGYEFSFSDLMLIEHLARKVYQEIKNHDRKRQKQMARLSLHSKIKEAARTSFSRIPLPFLEVMHRFLSQRFGQDYYQESIRIIKDKNLDKKFGQFLNELKEQQELI